MPLRSDLELSDRFLSNKKNWPKSGSKDFSDCLVKGFSARVTHTGFWSYNLFYRAWVDGKRKGERYNFGDKYSIRTLAEAREKAREIRSRVLAGENPAAEKRAQRSGAHSLSIEVPSTFGRIRALFIENYTGKSNKKPISDKTKLDRKRYLDKDFAHLDALAMADIRRHHIEDVRDRMINRGAGVASNRAMDIVDLLFKWACQRGYIEGPPVTMGLERRGAEKDIRDPEQQRLLEKAEIVEIWKACRPGETFDDIIRLLILTGQRRGEVARMRWSYVKDIQFQDGFDKSKIIETKHWVLPGGIDGITKNRVTHNVFLSNLALSIISERAAKGSSDYVFAGRGGAPFGNFSKSKKEFDKRVDLAKPWTLHDIRRAFVSHLNDAPLSVRSEVIEAIVNHVSGHRSGVAGVYNLSAYQTERYLAMNAWDRHFRGFIEPHQENVVPLNA